MDLLIIEVIEMIPGLRRVLQIFVRCARVGLGRWVLVIADVIRSRVQGIGPRCMGLRRGRQARTPQGDAIYSKPCTYKDKLGYADELGYLDKKLK